MEAVKLKIKIAFCLYKYFPYGGLQYYFLKIWRECQRRGHETHVFAREWEGGRVQEMNLHLIPSAALSNISRDTAFVKKLQSLLSKGDFDVVVGCNKMPGLDVYLQADSCYLAKHGDLDARSSRRSRRFRHFSHYEAAVFRHDGSTHILLLAEAEKAHFQRHYSTPDERFTLLPPASLAVQGPKPEDIPELRTRHRQNMGIGEQDFLILFIASNFKLKGLDRAIRALASLPKEIRQRSSLYVIGKDSSAKFKLLACLKAVSQRVKFLGAHSELLDFVLAADLLIHPAYLDNTGTIIYQALAAGLPVLTTEVCGFANHVQKSGAGRILSSPFSQKECNRLLLEMLTSPERSVWSQNGLSYGLNPPPHGMPETAADVIENIATSHRQIERSLPISFSNR